MDIIAIRSDKVYNEILNADVDKKNDIYRYKLMQEFEYKWKCYNIPIKAKEPNGYDVIMASSMLGYLEPAKIDEGCSKEIALISKDDLWKVCTESIQKALEVFESGGIELKVNEYKYTIILPDPNSVYSELSDGCLGDGGIPGSIFLSLYPNERNIKRIPSVLAHECNHNVRFQYINWSNNITLEEMMINEGLAENYATMLYGEEFLGPWVTSTNIEELNEYVKPIIKEALNVTGLDNITSYLYGDEIAKKRGYFPQGLPFCAGYACGYYMMKYYLKKTGKSITEATILPYEEIKKDLVEFWRNDDCNKN